MNTTSGKSNDSSGKATAANPHKHSTLPPVVRNYRLC